MKRKTCWLLTVTLSAMLVFLPVAHATPLTSPETIISEVLNLIESIYWQNTNRQTLVEGAIAGMLQALNDPWTEYLTEQEYRLFMEAIKAEQAGLGILVVREDYGWVITEVFPAGPAERAGLLVGDQITSVNEQAAWELDGDRLMDLLSGEQNSWVVVSITRNGQLLRYRLMRELVTVPTVKHNLLGGGLGYLRIDSFGENTPDEVATALTDLRADGIKGLVLDLRDNPGGLMDSVIGTAQQLLPAGPVLRVHRRDGTVDTIEITGSTTRMQMVVLVNQLTASAAEVLAGAIRDQADGLLIGDTTFGKGVMQDIYELDGYGAMKITSAMFTTPKGAMINQIGLEPDLVIQPETQGLPFLSSMRTLYPGLLGEEVSLLQQALGRLGYYHGNYTGRYDKLTEEAVRAVQASWALDDGDGVADTWTQLQINELLMQQAVNLSDQATLDAARAWLSSRLLLEQPGLQQIMSWVR